MNSKKPSRIRKAKAGFALILTLMLMILLTVLAVGLLGLSSISLRSSSQGKAQAEARANARMALMIAIGDLQKYAGPDTRATARADILTPQNPPVTGVWRSWEGDDHEPSGRPKTPDYASEKQQRFLAWLVSGDQANVPDTSSGATKVTLVGPGTVGADVDRKKLQIHLPANLLKQGNVTTGGMAWWVSGENQKARIPAPYKPKTDKDGKWATHMKSHMVADPDVFRMEKVLTDETLASRAVSLKQTDLIATPGALKTANEFYHDLSASSVGLLTNTATGGWKKDLSLLSENQSLIGTNDLPLFRVSPTSETKVTLATSNTNRGTQSVFYPWSDYRGTGTTRPADQNAAVASWNNLLDYTQIYKKSSGNGSTIPLNFYSILGSSSPTAFQYLHQVRILPVVARTQWVHSYYAVQPSPPQAGVLQAAMVVTPVVTMWNPYNLSITTNSLTLRFGIEAQGNVPLPVAFSFTVGGVPNGRFQSLTPNSNYSNGVKFPSLINVPAAKKELVYKIEQAFTLLPGETKVFSPTTLIEDTELVLVPGYTAGKGHLCKLRRNNGTVNPPPFTASDSATISTELVFDSKSSGDNVGNDLGVEVDGTVMPFRHRLLFEPSAARSFYRLSGSLSASVPMSALTTTPFPFLTTVFGARMASNTQTPTKGFLQSSPFATWPVMGNLENLSSYDSYGGTKHPVNASMDYSFNALYTNDPRLPGAQASTNRGFIATGFQSGDGLSRCVAAELPTRPLQSIAELQHWDMRYDNPVPPFAFNLIGNSDATPLLPANSVISNNFAVAKNLRHDDSYCANHLLFDDWFFSSIAPDPDDFGVSGKDMQRVYRDFVSGTAKLPNAAYRPINADRAGDPTALYNTHVKTADSWKTIASRLEVEGMFNVNSTSRGAWRAVLGHARNQKIPYLQVGTTSQVKLSGETDFAVSRFSVSGDSDTSSAGSSGAFPGATEFTGYRIMDEPMIDALADAIVEQVRKRGPFLSLSEFVNRQLTTGNLALAGAIQSALNEIAKSSATNPYKGITGFMSRIASKDPGAAGHADDGYEFPDAAEGETTYGLPGWTRQADILRPLAPTLTARDDTFTIRSYGDARDRTGNIIATAVCEAVVQRTRDFVDPTDPADKNVSNLTGLNRTFGRRFELVGFRWLNSNEI